MFGFVIGDFAFNPRDRSLIGVRHHDGLATLVRVAHPYDDWKVVRELPYGVVPSDLDISADGKLLSMCGESSLHLPPPPLGDGRGEVPLGGFRGKTTGSSCLSSAGFGAAAP